MSDGIAVVGNNGNLNAIGQALDNAFFELSPEDWKKLFCFAYTQDQEVLKLLYDAIMGRNEHNDDSYVEAARAALDKAQNALDNVDLYVKFHDIYSSLKELIETYGIKFSGEEMVVINGLNDLIGQLVNGGPIENPSGFCDDLCVARLKFSLIYDSHRNDASFTYLYNLSWKVDSAVRDLFPDIGLGSSGERVVAVEDIGRMCKNIANGIDSSKEGDELKKEITPLLERKLDVAKANLKAAMNIREDTLLSLALRYNPSDIAGQYKIDSITKSTDADGNVTYKAIAVGDTNGDGKDTDETWARVTDPNQFITVGDVTKHLSISYFALAMCYEKALIVQDQIFYRTEELEEINGKIKENNGYLKKSFQLYEKVYAICASSSSGGTVDVDKDFPKLKEYVKKISSDTVILESKFTGGQYDTQGIEVGKDGGTKEFSNIDVKEQGYMTNVSNAQDVIRIRGDELSTDSQTTQTKLTQLVQNFNSFLGIASQLCKSIGEYFKSLASNIR